MFSFSNKCLHTRWRLMPEAASLSPPLFPAQKRLLEVSKRCMMGKKISRESSCSLVIIDPFDVFLIIFRYFQKLPPWKSIQEQSHRRKTVVVSRLGENRKRSTWSNSIHRPTKEERTETGKTDRSGGKNLIWKVRQILDTRIKNSNDQMTCWILKALYAKKKKKTTQKC